MSDIIDESTAKNAQEKRARKALSRLGLVPVEDVNRVTFKLQGNIFAISAPLVYRAPGSDTYVVFGEAKNDDFMSRLSQSSAASALDPSALAQANDGIPALEEEEEDPNVVEDEEGLEADEIESIIAQTSVSRNKAIRALREHGTVVDAILSLQ